MKRILLALGIVLCAGQVEGAEQVQINENWKVDDNVYTLKMEPSYDESRVNIYTNICVDFHKADFIKSCGQECDADLIEEQLTVHRDFLGMRANEFKSGDLSLLLLSKEDEILGGAYIKMGGDDQTVCIRGAGYKVDIGQKEMLLAQQKMMAVLSSSQNFPSFKRLVLFLKEGSQLIPVVYHLGFKDSDYPVPETTLHPAFMQKTKILSFEKPIIG
jgi:hypothetical protein